MDVSRETSDVTTKPKYYDLTNAIQWTRGCTTRPEIGHLSGRRRELGRLTPQAAIYKTPQGPWMLNTAARTRIIIIMIIIIIISSSSSSSSSMFVVSLTIAQRRCNNLALRLQAR